jgi:signal transduction protein with GAF and PtsI domain
LIGLGYETLSVAPPALPRIRWLVRQLSRGRAAAAAAAALEARTDVEVLEILRSGIAACGVDPLLL